MDSLFFTIAPYILQYYSTGNTVATPHLNTKILTNSLSAVPWKELAMLIHYLMFRFI